MKRAQFIEVISETLGIEGKTVNVVTRVLREAGHLTTGPRGVNAPHMTPRDAAAVCLALMTGEGPTKVLGKFEKFSEYIADDRFDEERSELLLALGADANSTLLQVMEMAFAAFEDEGIFEPFLKEIGGFECLPPFRFTLYENTANVSFKDGSNTEIIFEDMMLHKRMQERAERRYQAQREENWELVSKLLDEDSEEHPILNGSSKGMRVSRTITVVEFQKIGTALFASPETARRDDVPIPEMET